MEWAAGRDPLRIRRVASEPGRVLTETPIPDRGDALVEADRAAAIAAAVARAQPGDTVRVAGKGHEQGHDIAGVVRAFDDRQVLRAAIENAASSSNSGMKQ